MTTNNDDINVRKELIDKIDMKYYKNTGWGATRCPFCDIKNKKKFHLNINLNEGEPLIYKCFRASCGITGLLDRKLLRKLGITSIKLLEAIENESIKYSKYKNNKNYLKNEKTKLKLPLISNQADDYFFERTGYYASEYQDYFRIISNLEEFYNMNKKYIDYNKVKYLINLEKKSDFIYFINDTYTMIHYREVKPNGKKGKLTLINENKNDLRSHKPYSFFNKGEKSLHNKKSNTLVLAEGTFDIINTYLYMGKDLNGYFISSNGFSATKNIILEFTKYYYKPYIVISSDSDVDIKYYKNKLLPKIQDRISDLVIFYNTKAEDMGDISKGIKIKKYKIK